MSYPILASGSTWYTQGGTSVAKSTITSIEIKDSYTPAGTVTSSWDASVNKDGSITAFIEGTKLTIAGNGSGKIYLNSKPNAMFSQFTAVTSITGLNILDTSKATTLVAMFKQCTALTTVDVSSFNTSNVTDTWNMFIDCTSLRSIGDVSNWDTSKVDEMDNMFSNCTSLTSIPGIGNWNVGNVTNMRGMFWHCTALTSLDVSNWDTSKVTDMYCMFCQSDYGQTTTLTELDVSKWDVSNVTTMAWMFYGLSKIKTLDVSKWNVSKCKNFHHMFAWCTQLVLNDKVSNWDVSNAEYLGAMFHQNQNTVLDLSKWNVSKNKSFAQMFERNTLLTEIKGLEKWDTSSGKIFAEMFSGCSNLIKLDLSSFNTTGATESFSDYNGDKDGINNIFGISGDSWSGMHNLQEVHLGENFSFNGDGTCTNVPVLPTPNSSYITGADGYWYETSGNAMLSSEIPSKKAGTYYGSSELVRDFNVLVKTGSLIDIATEIRNKANTDTRYKPSEMATAISDLSIEINVEKNNVSGSIISVNDVSEISHDVNISLSSDTITDFSDVTVKAVGKNLATAQQVWNGVAEYTETIEDGRNVIRFKSHTTRKNVLPIFEENTQYVFSFDCKSKQIESTSGQDAVLYVYYTDGTTTMKVIGSNVDWTRYEIVSTAGKTVEAVGMNSYNYVNYVYIDIDTFQLEKATVATEYEPYQEQTTTANANGTVEGIASISPNMTVFTDNEDVDITMAYYPLGWDGGSYKEGYQDGQNSITAVVENNILIIRKGDKR